MKKNNNRTETLASKTFPVPAVEIGVTVLVLFLLGSGRMSKLHFENVMDSLNVGGGDNTPSEANDISELYGAILLKIAGDEA